MGFLSSIGKIFNDVSGATSAAKMQYGYQKEFMQNAHQWEVQDMEKAGLNPILSADGSGATGNAAAVGTGSMNPAGLITSLLEYSNRNEANKIAQQDTNAKTVLATAKTKEAEAQTKNILLNNDYIKPEKKAQIANIEADTLKKQEEAKLTSAKTLTENEEKFLKTAQYYKENEEKNKLFWENWARMSDAKFVNEFGVTKDQAIELYKSTGDIIGNFIPKTNKLDFNTKKTSAKKPNNPRIAIDKKGEAHVIGK